MSKKRQLPDTSHAANKAATIEMRQGHYMKIINALTQLGTANYEKIADHVGLERNAVGRRVGEMEGLQLIFKPGSKSPTKSGRMAYDYCLTGAGMPKVDPAITYKKNEKSAHEYANDLIKEINKPLSTQSTLF